MPITNHSNKKLYIVKDTVIPSESDSAIIYPYSKAIAQCLFLPVPQLKIKEVSIDDIYAIKSQRQDGKLGSSNK